MWRYCVFVCVFLFGISSVSGKCDAENLDELLMGIQRSMQYFMKHSTELNLDSLVGTRMTGDQLTVLAGNIASKDFLGKDNLMLRLEYLAEMSDYIVNKSLPYVRDFHKGYLEKLEGILAPRSWMLNYPTRSIVRSLQEVSLPCEKSKWFPFVSDTCLSQVSQHDSRHYETCNISSQCKNYMTSPGFREYVLTHQILFLQIAEMHNCTHQLAEMGADVAQLQDYLCANVLRDAEEIAGRNYPKSHLDLFFEQIAVCGMWGYKDFRKDAWIDKILSSQEENGCYIVGLWQCQDPILPNKSADARRESETTERNDRILEGGCSVHATTVAMAALTVSLRFCAEEFIESTTV